MVIKDIKKSCRFRQRDLHCECSISRVLFRHAVAIIYLFPKLLSGYSDTTRGVQRATSSPSYLVLLRMGFTKPSNCLLAGALLPHRSTLTGSEDPAVHFSVALSLRFPSPDVIRHSALWSSDFPHRSRRNAAIAFHTHMVKVP